MASPPSSSLIKHSGSCSCGAIQVGILTNPFLKFYCHCSNCRRFVRKYNKDADPYNGGGFVWKWSLVLLKEEGEIEYEYMTALGGLMATKRGRCAKCKDVVVEYGLRGALPLAFATLPTFTTFQPDTNIFYNSGEKKGTLGMPRTLYSDWGSLLYETWCMFCGLLQIPELVWKRIRALVDPNLIKA